MKNKNGKMMKNLTPILLTSISLMLNPLWANPSKEVLDQFLSKYCFDCHDGDIQKGKLNLEDLTYEISENNHDTWDRAFKNIWFERMPPKEKKKQPSLKERMEVLKAINNHKVSHEEPVLRLSPLEVEYALEDLFGLKLDIKNRFEKQTSHFNKSYFADSLSKEDWGELSLILDEIIERLDRDSAVISSYTNILQNNRGDRLIIPKNKSNVTINKAALSPAGAVDPYYILNHQADYEGHYKIKFRTEKLKKDQESVALVVYAGTRGSVAANNDQKAIAVFDVTNNVQTIEFESWLNKGETFAFFGHHDSFYLQHPKKKKEHKTDQGVVMYPVTVEGPLSEDKTKRTDLKEILQSSTPLKTLRSKLLTLAKEAYGREVTNQELKSIIDLRKFKYKKKADRKKAYLFGVKRILLSPAFIYKEQRGHFKQNYLKNLSLFLWRSPIYTDSLKLAADLDIKAEAGKNELIERMMNHKKHKRFVKSWVDKWLHLDEFSEVIPDQALYPEFDEVLKFQMPQETIAFINYIYENDQPLSDFIKSEYSLLSERLARHYNIKGVKGEAIRKINLPKNSLRGGLMTQASLLTMTNDGVATSPIIRGMWVLEKILGFEIVLPKIEVPAAEPDTRGASTIKQQLEKHRSDQACMSCHKLIDPPGFSLERFDVIGQARNFYRTSTKDFSKATFTFFIKGYFQNGLEVDDTFQTEDGESYANINQYKDYLLDNSHHIHRNIAGQLIEMANGRSINWERKINIHQLLQSSSVKSGGAKSLVKAIANSQWVY